MPFIDRRCAVRFAVFFFALMSLFPAYASADITHNLVGWWKFDEGTSTVAHDSSGYGNNGTVCTFTAGTEGCGGLTTAGWGLGKFGSALSSTAAQPNMAWVQSSTTASQILNATSTGTVAAWIKLNSYQAWQMIACKEDLTGTAKNGYALRLNNSNPVIVLADVSNGSGGNQSAGGTMGIPLNQWVHVAMTWNGTYMNTYVNAVVDLNQYAENGVLASSTPSTFYIGKCTGDLNDTFDGSIDDVRVYNRALSAADIAQLYAEKVTVVRKPANNLGMVGWWKFDEGTSTNAHDSSGNLYNGVLKGATPPQWVTGKLGKALSFNGSSAYVTLPSTANIDFSGPMSVCAWVNGNVLNSGTTDFDIVSRFQGAGIQFEFYVTAGQESFDWTNSGGGTVSIWTANSTLSTGAWYHLCAVKASNSSVSLYKNGVSDSASCSLNCSGNTPAAETVAVNIGTDNVGNGYWWNGLIDDVRIYNRALSPYEVANLYQSKAAKVASTADLQNGSSLQTGLIGYWTFDGKDVGWPSANQAIIYDRSGMGNNGSTTGMTRNVAPAIGKIGQAFNFVGAVLGQGTPQYILFNHNGFNTTPFSNPSWTMAAWVKPDASQLDGGAHFIALYNSSGNATNGTPVIAIDQNEPEVSTWANDCISSNPIKAGKWIHIVGECDGTNMNLYVNGAFDKQCSCASQSISIADVNPRIGDDGFPYSGNIDDVRIYNRALTDREIKQLYKLGQATVRP